MAQLTLGEVELASGETRAGSLQGVRAEAELSGFNLIAAKAARALE
jgi:hypothetical protein